MSVVVIDPSVQIIDKLTGIEWLKKLELAGRVCYKSENRVTDNSYDKFLKTIIKNGHESVLEHVNITVKIVCSRSTSHQLVRHRISKITDDGIVDRDITDFAISQESQRYCNYNKNNELVVICPPNIKDDTGLYTEWIKNVDQSYEFYNKLIKLGIKPEDAREVLPNATKTELFMTNNLRQWRTIFKARTDKHAQWQVRNLMIQLLDEFKKEIPIVFDDIMVTE
jgi:thymidylate synthase (FAD)